MPAFIRRGERCGNADWGVLGELLGGEDRIDPTLFESSGDSLIVNLGAEEWVDVSLETQSRK